MRPKMNLHPKRFENFIFKLDLKFYIFFLKTKVSIKNPTAFQLQNHTSISIFLRKKI